ncbi:protein of unknown function (plasmid) [Cupriavidus taiwanensis]|uniref:Uncharacterized protein n=1 Tax=Cupriavidus taiwanensis TaxID=164546 RepID=A0A375HK43_9BURK|nr:hypothetical protein CBM2588_B170109 [Cupriavidus taiwanensis]SOY66359.1 hypothetical protein CBM2592_B130109 [Cupriavidus taiwanensis]SOZ27950.1 hypothetical protein CBM2608_B130108 [Cupriavidus taiwanensis]SOZ70493.1 hypothetical protein CBM2617_B160108 [Cupriavidus taiwanensis]SOZ94408.1 hypothetical protein CBM2621_B170108 [Cupriavidus taiwanensis]
MRRSGIGRRDRRSRRHRKGAARRSDAGTAGTPAVNRRGDRRLLAALSAHGPARPDAPTRGHRQRLAAVAGPVQPGLPRFAKL